MKKNTFNTSHRAINTHEEVASTKIWTILQTILWTEEIKINFHQKDGKLAEGEKTVHN